MWLGVGAVARAFPRRHAALSITASVTRSLLLRHDNTTNLPSDYQDSQNPVVIEMEIAHQCLDLETDREKARRPSLVRCVRPEATRGASICTKHSKRTASTNSI
jgi:hypothetical protein